MKTMKVYGIEVMFKQPAAYKGWNNIVLNPKDKDREFWMGCSKQISFWTDIRERNNALDRFKRYVKKIEVECPDCLFARIERILACTYTVKVGA